MKLLRWRPALPLRALVASAVLVPLLAASLARAANSPVPLDAQPERTPGTMAIGPKPEGGPAPTSANPLWSIPLATLAATRERPLFLPSRRPPAPAVAARPVQAAQPVAPAPAEPERPPLSLLGTVAGGADGFAVFINSTTRDTVRLKVGEGHEGWVLMSVRGREAVLEKDHRSAVMTLPLPAGDQR
ncbi:MAG: general secretion pathway protein GspN [Variibacter sp.]|nr:general secretion pathway protein GspN [Variibacter sp.]